MFMLTICCQVQIECISEAFQGKSTLQRQKLVYKAIWDELNGAMFDFNT